MFKSISDGQYSGGQALAASSGHGMMSRSGHQNPNSSWISVFSVVSRPAWSFLQKYLPGRPTTPVQSESVSGWVSELSEFKQDFVGENVFLGQLNEIMHVTQHSAHHVTCLRYQPSGAPGESTRNWFDLPLEIGIAENGGNTCPAEAAGFPMKRDRTGKSMWGGGSYESAQSWLSNAFLGKEWIVTSDHYAQTACGTNAPVAKTTRLFVQCASRSSKPGESAGRSSDKEKPNDNGSLYPSQLGPPQSSKVPSITSHVDGAGVATSCSEVAVLTPDQDNGYSSPEEEHTIGHLSVVKVISQQDCPTAMALKEGCVVLMIKAERKSPECREDEGSTTVMAKELVATDEEIGGGPEDEPGDATQMECSSATAIVPRIPLCQNKAIAFIMGASCSDDDDDDDDYDSQLDDEFSEDDGGFDSEGSSDLSDSSAEDKESCDEENEADSEAAHLWNSLWQSRDPYNPRNFTACIHTSTARAVPLSSASPASSPSQAPSPLSCSPASPPGLSSSPPTNQDSWDDSTSASEADEVESMHLWKSFLPDSDPYSPLNFQAPLRTREPPKAVPRTKGHIKKSPARSPWCDAPAAAPQYRKEDAEERLDSGFSELLACAADATTSVAAARAPVRKVRFCDNVEIIWASVESRRGPWEELARDRCRFQRRCQEVEQSIAYCLSPRHRSLALQRLTLLPCTQDS